MATRIETILSKARDTLADPSKERWSDDRLLRLLSEAQQDIVIHKELLKTTVSIPLIVGQAIYDLPDECYRILRASTNGYEIGLRSYDRMDEQAKNYIRNDDTSMYWQRHHGSVVRSDFDNRNISWEEDTGSEIEAVIYDNREPNKIRFYPIPNEEIAQAEYTFENAGPIVFAGDELLGVVTDIETDGSPDYTFDSPYGVVTSLFDPFVDIEIMESIDGVVTQVNETEGFVTIYYTQAAPEITELDAALSIPTMYDKAMKYYIIAHAYDDDYDTRNQEKSNKFLKLYERELVIAEKFSARDGTKAANFQSTYRGAF